MEEFASSSSGAFPSTGRTEADPMEESFHLLANKLEAGTYPDQTSFHLGEEGRPWFGDFPWSPQLQETLEGRFGFHSFKGLQLGPINALLSGKDVIANFPTGGGKSLIFQFPAVFREGVALVISPLLSLMEDQKRALLAKGIPAVTLEESTREEEVKRLLDDLKLDSPATRVLYITPERCGSDAALRTVLQSLLRRSKLVVIGLDEAHLIPIWGNDFRPDYKELKMLREWYPAVPMAAVTASATPEIKKEILETLCLDQPVHFSMGTFRPNIFLEVRQKPSGAGQRARLAEEMVGLMNGRTLESKPGIVYCLTRKECEEVAKEMNSRGVKAAFYHGDMKKVDRQRAQEEWLSGAIRVVVATVAFGLGIDNPACSFVFHYALPSTLDRLYQEVGRCGRGGQPSRALLWHSGNDVLRAKKLTCGPKKIRGGGRQARESIEVGEQQKAVREVDQFCLNNEKSCRWGLIRAHFEGETPIPPLVCRFACDVCARPSYSPFPPPLRIEEEMEKVKALCRLLFEYQKHLLKQSGEDADNLSLVYKVRGDLTTDMVAYLALGIGGCCKALSSKRKELLEEANIPSNGVLGRCWRQNRKHGVQSLKRLMDAMVEDGYFAERGADTGRGNRYPILDSLTEKGWTALGLEVPVPPPEERAVPSAVPPSPQGGQETSRDSGPVVPPSPLGASSPPKRRKIDPESKEENVISEDENEYEDLDFVIENDENEYEDEVEF